MYLVKGLLVDVFGQRVLGRCIWSKGYWSMYLVKGSLVDVFGQRVIGRCIWSKGPW